MKGNETIDDPTIMYIIVNSELDMSPGKLCAQVGHAVMTLCDTIYLSDVTNDTFANWRRTDYRKVILRAPLKEFNKLKELPGAAIIIDNGLTEVSAGSETCIGFPPIHKSKVPKLIKRLQVLK